MDELKKRLKAVFDYIEDNDVPVRMAVHLLECNDKGEEIGRQYLTRKQGWE